MPRSSFSDNPLLRVSRPVSACSRCRAAKVKCDGKLPACTACEKAGRENECSAANDQFARGKERSYVAALELRVEKLERRLAYARSRKASVAFHDGESSFGSQGPQPDRKDSLAVIRDAIHRKAARKRENSDVNSLVSDFGYLSVNATTRDFDTSVNNMTFARLVLAAAGNVPLPEPSTPAGKLPPRQASYPVVQYYLSHIHTIFPFFSETSLLALLEEVYHVQQPMTANMPPARPNLRSQDYWMLYMVLAIGSAVQSRNRHDTFYRNAVEYAAQAMPYADRALAPGHVTQIQSLLLLTLYSMLDPAHFDSWHLIGFTCRAIVDLGFHQDPPQSQKMDAAALDARRRTFYCAYALDRAISMVHARAFSFTDDAINVAFPSMIGVIQIHPQQAALNSPQSLHPPRSPAAAQSPISPSSAPVASSALLLFQLRRAQSHWYQTLYQSDVSEELKNPTAYVWRMCADMREWYDALPPTIPAKIREMFDLELQYSYVYCIAPSARSPLMTAYGRMLMFEHVIAYVDRMMALASGGLNLVWHTYHDALRVFFMGSQFVAVLRDTSTADAILAGGGSVPVPLAMPGDTPPPPMPVRTIFPIPPQAASPNNPNPLSNVDPVTGTNIDRSIACLERVSWTLSAYGE
ncbi:zn 2cys6 cluster transcripitional activator [Ophiostoma piceae UAMH 11346]|uniref:Zn 2cys6 cluster transcripitional activator n=1 Tax=Ophiostoma piceae (strain UAMH 11346) TaxID=1262450 RepID=S3CEQ1_OPHP1|nr:zn 2cys6 cluster transcripitional activator [Ophiostoma piceae UAMH 11346]